MDWTCGWLIETWLLARHTKTGKNFFPTILPLESFAVQLEKKFELRFLMKKTEFGGHLIWNIFRNKAKLLRPIFSSNFLHRCVKILRYFHKKNHFIFGINFCKKTNFVFFNDCLVQTCAYFSFCGKQLVGIISENSF